MDKTNTPFLLEAVGKAMGNAMDETNTTFTSRTLSTNHTQSHRRRVHLSSWEPLLQAICDAKSRSSLKTWRRIPG